MNGELLAAKKKQREEEQKALEEEEALYSNETLRIAQEASKYEAENKIKEPNIEELKNKRMSDLTWAECQALGISKPTGDLL